MHNRHTYNPYVELAETALVTYLKKGRVMNPKDGISIGAFQKKRGCFVTIRKGGELRGCMGTVQPVRDNLKDEIIHNAIYAGVMDSRFLPVIERELSHLQFSVSIVEHPESISTITDYNVSDYGIIVMKGSRIGLLLPGLKGVDTAGDQLRIALGKAGIDPEEQYTVKRFRTVHYT